MADQIPDYSPLQPPLPAGGIPDASLNLASRQGSVDMPASASGSGTGGASSGPDPLQAILAQRMAMVATPQAPAAPAPDYGYSDDTKTLDKDPFNGPGPGYGKDTKALDADHDPFGRGSPSLIGEAWKAVKHSPLDLEKGVGGAARFAGNVLQNGGYQDLGQYFLDAGDAIKANATGHENLSNMPDQSANFAQRVAGGAAGGVAQLGETVGAGAAIGAGIGALGGPIGAVGGGAIGALLSIPAYFGMFADEGYQRNYDAAVQQGKTADEARNIGLRAGGAEGTIGAGLQFVLQKVGLGEVAAPALKMMAGETAGRMVEGLLTTSARKTATGMAAHAGEMGGVMGAQDAAVQGIDMANGSRDQYDPMQTVEATASGAGMGLVTGSMGAVRQNAKTNATRNLLADTSQPEDVRAKTALGVSAVLMSADPKLAADFGQYAAYQIKAGKPIEVMADKDYATAAYKAAAEQRYPVNVPLLPAPAQSESPDLTGTKDIFASGDLDGAIAATEDVVNSGVKQTTDQIAASNQALDAARARYAAVADQANQDAQRMANGEGPQPPAAPPAGPAEGAGPAAPAEAAGGPNFTLGEGSSAADLARRDAAATAATAEQTQVAPAEAPNFTATPGPSVADRARADAQASAAHQAEVARAARLMRSNPKSVTTAQLGLVAESHPSAMVRSMAKQLLAKRRNAQPYMEPPKLADGTVAGENGTTPDPVYGATDVRYRNLSGDNTTTGATAGRPIEHVTEVNARPVQDVPGETGQPAAPEAPAAASLKVEFNREPNGEVRPDEQPQPTNRKAQEAPTVTDVPFREVEGDNATTGATPGRPIEHVNEVQSNSVRTEPGMVGTPHRPESDPSGRTEPNASAGMKFEKTGDPRIDFSPERSAQGDEAIGAAGEAPRAGGTQHNEATGKLQDVLNKRAEETGGKAGPQIERVDPASLPDRDTEGAAGGGTTLSKGHFALAQKFASIFGKNVELVRGKTGGDSRALGDGAVLHSDANTIYLNADAKSASHLAVVGHEIAHQMERDAPNIYEELANALGTQMRGKAGRDFYRYVNGIPEGKGTATTMGKMEAPVKGKGKKGKGKKQFVAGTETTEAGRSDASIDRALADPETRRAMVSEWVADLFGNRATESRTMTKLFHELGGANGKNRGLIYRIADYIVAFIDRLREGTPFRKFATDQMVSDMASVRREVLHAMKGYAEHQNSNGMSHESALMRAKSERLAEEKRAAEEAGMSAKQAEVDKVFEPAQAQADKLKAEAKARDAKKAAADAAAIAAKQAREAKAPTAAGINGTREPVKRTLTTDSGLTFEMRRNRMGDYSMYYDDKKIGQIQYDQDPQGWHVKNVNVDPEFQRQGVATAAHDFLESNVIKDKFRAGEPMSDYAAFREARDNKKAAEASANRSEGQKARMARENAVDGNDTFATALAKLGGLRESDYVNQLGGDANTTKEAKQHGMRWLISKDGLTHAQALEAMEQHGYLHSDDHAAEFESKLHDFMRDGTDHYTLAGEDNRARELYEANAEHEREKHGGDDEWQKELERPLSAEEEAAIQRRMEESQGDDDISFSKRRASADPEDTVRARGVERDGSREKPRMYAGEQAGTANHADLHDAQMRVLKGDDADKVRRETGWFRGHDGEWRHEISDENARFQTPWEDIPMGEHKLGDILSHTKLFQAYPELRNLDVEKFRPLKSGIQGGFNDPSEKYPLGQMKLAEKGENPLSTLLHEVQHYIQGKEGFDRGGNTEDLRLDSPEILGKTENRLRDLEAGYDAKDAEQEAKYPFMYGPGKRRATELERSFFLNDHLAALKELREKAPEHSKIYDEAEDAARTIPELVAMRKEAEGLPFRKYEEARAAWQKEIDARNVRIEAAREKYEASKSKEDLDAYLASMKEPHPKMPFPDYSLGKEDIKSIDLIMKEMEKRLQAAKTVGKGLKGIDDFRFQAYRHLGGEREARDVQRRQLFNDEERNWVPPYSSEDIPDSHTIRNPQNAEQLGHSLDRLTDPDGNPAGDLGIDFSKQRADYMGKLTPKAEKALEEVGAIVKGKTVKQAFKDYFKGLGERLEQAIAHRYAPIRKYTPEGFMQARMARGSDGALEALLLFGKPIVDKDGAYDVNLANNPNGGFAKVLQSLKGEHQRFFWWVAAHRAGDLLLQNKELNFDAAKIAELKKLDEHDNTNPNRPALFKAALAEYSAYNERMLEIAHDAGLISNKTLKEWSKNIYVPFYRVMDDAGKVLGPRNVAGLGNQKIGHKLTGSPEKLNADLLSNVMQNWSHILGASARNRAARTTLEAAANAGAATIVPQALTKKGESVHVMVNGKEVYYRVNDKALFSAVSAMYAQIPSWMKPFAQFKHMLTFGVTSMPGFKIRNLIRDTITTSAISDAKNPLDNLLQGFGEAIKGHHSQTYASMLASGGVIRFGNLTKDGEAKSTHRLVRMGIPRAQILDHPGKLQALMDTAYKGWHAYSELGDMSENVNRIALYKKLREQGKSHMEASFAARDLMDFSDGGTHWATQFLTQSVPFLNARIQGLAKIGSEAAKRPKQMLIAAGAVAMASVGLYLANKDDKDFQNLEPWARDNYWWAKVGGKMVAIPRPFELGAIGTLAERLTELHLDPLMTKGQLLDSVKNIMLDQFAFDPRPQIVKPIWDSMMNKDSFTGRPLESMALQKLQPQDRYNVNTSMTARGLGSVSAKVSNATHGIFPAISPVKWDAMLKDYFGQLGQGVLQAVDMIARPATGQPSNTKALRLSDKTLGFVHDPVEEGSTKYVTQMYDHMRDVEEAYNSWHAAMRTGRPAEAKEMFDGNKSLIVQYHQVEAIKRAESRLSLQSKRIQNSMMLSDEAKQEQLQRIQQTRNAMAKNLMTQPRVLNTM